MPLTLIDTAPPPELTATIALPLALIDLPVADWVKAMPPVPLCVSANATAPALTGVSEFSVTDRAVVPLALRDCVRPTVPVPAHTNTPLPAEASSHKLVKALSRSKVLAAPPEPALNSSS